MADPLPAAPSTEPRPRLALALVGLGVVAFAVFHTLLAHWKAAGLMSEWGFDLTFFHNLVWNVAEGNGYRQSATFHEPPGIFAETHFEPIVLLAVPFYKVVPRLETLFAVQSTLLGLGAVGVYRLSRSGGARPLAGAAAAWIYLGFWPVWRMAMADIRPLTWALPFLLLCVAALREGRRWETFTWGLLACMSREEVPLLVLFVAAAALIWSHPPVRERRKVAISLAMAAVFFAVATTLMRSNTTFYIRPGEWIRGLLGGGDGQSIDPGWGQSASDLLSVRLRFLGGWLVPVGLGALAAPELLAASAPLFVYLFSQPHEWASWEGPYIHHTAPALGLVCAAAALGWSRLLVKVRAPKWVVIGLLLALAASEVVLLTGVKVGPDELIAGRWNRYVYGEISPWLEPEERVVEAHRLADQVPDDAPVMADWQTVHLFSGRAAVYSYHQESPEVITPGPEEPLVLRAEVQPLWALINTEDGAWIERSRAHGLREVDRGGDWVLLGP